MIPSKQEIEAQVQAFAKEGLSVSPLGAGKYHKVPAKDRMVGIAYALWNRKESWPNCWDRPLLGEYSSLDREIIRKHAIMIKEAGVDFVWVDWSNNVNFDPKTQTGNGSGQDIIEQGTAILFDEYSKMDNPPKISIFAGVTLCPEAAYDGRLQKKADQIYEQYIEKYPELIVTHLEKPLLVVYVHTPSPWQDKVPEWADERFTVRYMTGDLTQQPSLITDERISKYGYWSWEDRGAQTFTVYNGTAEEMLVQPSWRPQDKPGSPSYIPGGERLGGKTLKEQFARARLIGPKFAMVVTFNEWHKGEQISKELSKDFEPSEAFGTFYMDLLKEEVHKFKTLD